MIESKNTTNDCRIFAVFTTTAVFLGWIAYLTAIGGFFYSWIFLGFILLMLATLTRQIIRKKFIFNISREFAIISSAILLFVLVSSFFITPSIFSGRDQGSLSEAAIHLSQNHRLEFSTPAISAFFKIYGEGKALNFPGFYFNPQGDLITQFPIAYISWLAIFYSLFGLAGLIAANAVLLFIFLTSFYLLARNFVKVNLGVMVLTLIATSFPMFWFTKFTLSENMALSLLWLSILWLYLFIKKKQLFYYFSFLVSAGLLVFTRIEGIFLLISGFLAAYIFTRKENFWKENRKIILWYPAIFLALIFAVNLSKDIYFYKEMGKALIHIRQDQINPHSVIDNLFSPILFEFRVFFLYGLTGVTLVGIFGIIYFWIKKQWKILVPFFVIIPSLVYLLNPYISSDHPWMLRRFFFSIIPVFVFYSISFLIKWTDEKKSKYLQIIFYLFFISTLALNLSIFIRYFPFSENKGLLRETEKISNNFKSSDLVLVDRLASGDGWSMISGPMSSIYGNNAVYFFNPEDLQKIDKSSFSKIYLIAPQINIPTYEKKFGKDNIVFVKDYSIETERLSSSRIIDEPLTLPEKETVKIKGKIFEIKL